MPDETPNRVIESTRLRKTIYHIIAGALAIAGVWGFISAEEAEQYLQAAVLVLGVGGSELAATNTPKTERLEPTDTEQRPDLE